MAVTIVADKAEAKEEKKEAAQFAAAVKDMKEAVVEAIAAKSEAPAINVTVEAPEAPEIAPIAPVKTSPRIWVFKHKYDEYNKLVETTATAQ